MSDSSPSAKNKADDTLSVVVGLLFNGHGNGLGDGLEQVLVQQRTEPPSIAGLWEFPGGKVEPGESVHEALVRELSEELDVTVISSVPFMRVRYRYPERNVMLEVCEVTQWTGDPRGVEGQPFQWTTASALRDLEMLEANTVMVDALLRREAALKASRSG